MLTLLSTDVRTFERARFPHSSGDLRPNCPPRFPYEESGSNSATFPSLILSLKRPLIHFDLSALACFVLPQFQTLLSTPAFCTFPFEQSTPAFRWLEDKSYQDEESEWCHNVLQSDLIPVFKGWSCAELETSGAVFREPPCKDWFKNSLIL